MLTLDIKELFGEFVASSDILTEAQALEKYLNNTLSISRAIDAVIKIKKNESLAGVIKIANKHAIPLYPISGGKNWGYGCAIPPTENCVILDLSAMNKIVSFEKDNGLIVVEPGVTQEQLYNFLQANNYQYLVPTTGSGPTCSLLGNALERGFGLSPYCDHYESASVVEAILPDGVKYTGCIPQSQESLINIPNHGLGPDLNGLFFQSNYAVVTKILIKLFPKPEASKLVIVKIYHHDLDKCVISKLKQICRQVGSQHMSNITLMHSDRFARFSKNMTNKKPHWVVFFSIYGSNAFIRAIQKTISKSLSKIKQRRYYFNFNRFKILKKIAQLFHLAKLDHYLNFINLALNAFNGIPSQNGLRLVYEKVESHKQTLNPALDGCGLIWFSPIMLFEAKAMQDFYNKAQLILKAHKQKAYISFTNISEYLVFISIPIIYDKCLTKELAIANKCYQDLQEAALESKCYFHRLGMQSIEHPLSTINKTHWQVVKQIKTVLDPNNIISPGRYELS